jgi:NAD+ synthase (glutamine-hydrolysing)
MLTIALAQFRPRKGDYAANLARVTGLLAQAAALDPRPQVVAFPETSLSGYFVEGAVRDLAVPAARLAEDLDAGYRAAAGASAEPIDVVIGFYEVWRATLHNSALYVTLGGDGPASWHVHRKNFLPTYGMFDEERFVERGHAMRAFDTPWGRAGMLVCEDAWHSLTGTLLALDGAQLVFVVSAAPARGVWPRADDIPGPASTARWERLVRDIAEEHGVFVALTNLVGSEGGKVFGGTATIVGPKGDVRVRGPQWEEALVVHTLDLEDVTRARADMPLLSDLRTALPLLKANLEAIEKGITWDLPPALPADDAGRAARDVASGAHGVDTHAPAPKGGRASVPGEKPIASDFTTRDASPATAAPVMVVHGEAQRLLVPPLVLDPELTERFLVRFLQDEFARRGFRKAIVGLSGGVDSAVTTYLAARALGAENVVAVRMPYRTSSADSLAHAQLVIDDLQVEARTVDISAAVDGYLAQEPEADGTRRGNIMARMRMIVLFDLSARHRALPLGTGNKTERLMGYFTWHADDSPPVNPIGDLFKTQVWALARHLGVPAAIVDKPASADLVQGQTDEGDFGISYAKADDILNAMVAGYSARDLVARGWDAPEVELVRRRLEGTHWKRRLPAVAMVSPTAIGESYLRPVDY